MDNWIRSPTGHGLTRLNSKKLSRILDVTYSMSEEI